MELNQSSENELLKKYHHNYKFGIFIVLIFILGFSVGKISDKVKTPANPEGLVENTEQIPEFLTKDVDFDQFWKVWNYVKQNYVKDDIKETQLFYGALKGMVSALDDPYSVFFDPEVSSDFAEALSGSFEGIGAEIGLKEDVVTVIAPLSNTPASNAGLRAGDLILKIDEVDARGISLDYAVSIIRGPKGEPVVLNIYTPGDDEPRDVSIIRDTIEIDSVKFSRADGKNEVGDEDAFALEDGDIAYLELLYFNENTLADWNKTVQKILALNPKGIVLDLRNNPGGFLSTAIEISGEWVNGKDVVKERLRDGTEIAHHSSRVARFDGIPTVVLINGGSASGSEIVAGALQDYGVATLVGETSFGKGSVQDVRQFSDGSSVKLTIAEWLTPLGRNINEEGITPDIEIELTREDYDAGLDPQLDKAFEILRSAESQ